MDLIAHSTNRVIKTYNSGFSAVILLNSNFKNLIDGFVSQMKFSILIFELIRRVPFSPHQQNLPQRRNEENTTFTTTLSSSFFFLLFVNGVELSNHFTTMAREFDISYTLGFIRCEDNNKILLLNRNKPPWMGLYNGIGGKIQPNETPLNV